MTRQSQICVYRADLLRFGSHKIGLFLPTLFGTPMICVYHADRNVFAHCMRPQKSLRWVWRLGERWTFRIDHGQSHVDVGHVVFIMICVHIQRNGSECQTFRSEVCRPPFEYGIGTISCHTDSWCADETARTFQKMKIRY